MGEVYKAKDARLDRLVAVKVLPSEFAADAERLRRFEQEARAASALNHPNIVAVYDIGTQDAVSYMAMELVDGQSLRDLTASGALTARRTLEVGTQLAEGIAKAHSAGIIHRDLKPENVMISRDGFVKILDFGLAKGMPVSDGALSQLPTVAPETGAGMILGTVAYMSPEQAAGRPIDYRSDQFSLGTILYELVSGRKPFSKPSAVETLSAIIRDEPPPLSQSTPPCPAPLRWIVERCHAKEVEGRYASTFDLASDLKSLRDHFSELSSSSGFLPAGGDAGRAPRTRFKLPLAAAAIAGAIAGAAILRTFWKPASAPPPALRYLTYSGQDVAPAVSPDGSLLAFASLRDGKPRIWLKQLKNGSETALTGGPDLDPRFSPDGASLLFTHFDEGRPSLVRISVLGGETRKIVEHAAHGDWSPDGRSTVYVRASIGNGLGTDVFSCDADGGGERHVAAAPPNLLNYPRWSPDGNTIAAGIVSPYISSAVGILLIDARTNRARRLPPATTSGAIRALVWSEAKTILYEETDATAGGGQASAPARLYEQSASGGKPQEIFALPGSGSAVDVLADGRLVLDLVSPRENLREYTIEGDQARPLRWLTRGIATDRQPYFSPDGRWIAFSSSRNGNVDIWKTALSTGELRRLTESPATDWDPAFTPDGKSIVFSSDRTGHYEIWMADSDGSNPRQITRENADCENPAISPDAAWIYFVQSAGSQPGVRRVHFDGSGDQMFRAVASGSPEVSTDGELLAATTLASEVGIEIYRTADGKSAGAAIPARFPSGNAAGRYFWLPGTHRLLLTGRDLKEKSGIFAQPIGAGIAINPVPFAAFDSDFAVETFAVSPDGKTLITAEQEQQANILVVDNVPGVKAKAGARSNFR